MRSTESGGGLSLGLAAVHAPSLGWTAESAEMSSITREAAADASTTTSEAASSGQKVRTKSGKKSGTKNAKKAAKKKRVPAYRVTGLDGVRAIAVLLVILYHLSPGAVIGGYIGVDLFFVVSGFLITTLLLREREATGRISLYGFWRRRARRLLPALGVLVLVCCTAAYAVGRDVLLGLGAQVLGARDLQQQLAVPRRGVRLLQLDGARALPQPLVARRRGAVLPPLAAVARPRAGADPALAADHR